MLHRPLALQNDGPSAFDIRQLIRASHGTGVINSGDFAVSQRGQGANMTVDVAAGRAVVDGPAGGRYLLHSDAVENLPIAAAPGPGNSRIDLVYARVRDEQAIGAGGDNDFILGVVTGVASASPTPPGTPANALALGRVTLTSSTSSITDGIIADTRWVSVEAAQAVWPRVSWIGLPDQTATSSSAQWGAPMTFQGLIPNRNVIVMAWASGTFSPASSGASVVELSVRISTGATVNTSPSASSYSPTALSPTMVSQFYASSLSPGVGAGIDVRARIIKTSGPDADFIKGSLMAAVFPR